jgi:transcriptional regulator with XRE-family HTH domain
MARTPRPSPAELAPGWPDVRTQDAAGEAARQFARRLREAIDAAEGGSVRKVARAAGLSHATLLAILNGVTWADLYTVAKLEVALGRSLWHGPLN